MAQTAHPDINDPNQWVLYRYTPSLVAAIIFAILFALTTIYHTYQIVQKRTWYFIPLAVGGAFEFIGYIGRAVGHYDQWNRNAYIVATLLLLVAPALFAASIYIILGRIILLTSGERHSLIRKTWLTKIFVTGDVLSFMAQGAGGGIMASGTESGMKNGENIIVGGLFIQLVFFGFFIAVVALFHYRLERRGGPANPDVDLRALPWKKHMYALYATSALIFVRSVFRVIEYLGGNAGYLLRHEVYLYIFDAVLMLAVMIIFNAVHPCEITQLYNQRISMEAHHSREERDVEMQPKEGARVMGGPWS